MAAMSWLLEIMELARMIKEAGLKCAQCAHDGFDFPCNSSEGRVYIRCKKCGAREELKRNGGKIVLPE